MNLSQFFEHNSAASKYVLFTGNLNIYIFSSRPVLIQRQCADSWDVYRQLARTRLGHGHGAGTSAAAGQVAISSETVTMVTRYLEEWTRTAKIPATLMEDIMFRKPVYEAQVLPALLSVNLASDNLEVSRDQLVTALHSKGKVRYLFSIIINHV